MQRILLVSKHVLQKCKDIKFRGYIYEKYNIHTHRTYTSSSENEKKVTIISYDLQNYKTMQKEVSRVIKIQTGQALSKWYCVYPHLHVTHKQLKLHTWLHSLQPLRLYIGFVLRWGEKMDFRKDSIFSTLPTVFYWNVAPKPLSTAVHEISWPSCYVFE